MSIDQYIFWSEIQYIAKNLEDLSDYREGKWIENFSFKENLKINIKNINNLLENTTNLKIKLRAEVKSKNEIK